MARLYLTLGSLCGFLAVALGAFGAHALSSKLSERMLSVWATATDYQFYHALALVLVALISLHFPASAKLRWAARFFFAGICIFCGSLYFLALTGINWLGAITPIGGVVFLLGWLTLALFAIKDIPHNS